VNGYILVAWSASIGVFEWDGEEALLNQHIFKIEFDHEKIERSFFKIALKKSIEDLVRFSHGSTMKHIVKKDFENHRIILPPIDDQARIATLLSKVESLIARRKKSIADLDELLKSTFLEMFGDPVRNDMRWAKEKFGNMLENIDSGWSPKCEPYASKMDEWGVLKLGAVTSCIYDERENKALIQGTQSKDNLEVRAGDLLFSRKNTYELVAACAYVFKTRSKLMLSDLIFRLVLKKEARVNPIFLWKLLTNYSQRKVIQSLAGGAAGSMPNISKTKLKIVKIPVPPETLQNKFAAIVEKVEALKGKYQDSLKDLETLYGALSQKAFKGELDLSRIPLAVHLKPKDIFTGKPEVGEPTLTVQDQPVKTPESREQALHQLFKTFLSGTKSKSISLDDFWLEAEEKFLDLMDEDAPPLGIADYDRVRDLMFEMLASGKVAQVFNEQENRMEIRAVS
jgi:type I restriction enzyme S subunit